MTACKKLARGDQIEGRLLVGDRLKLSGHLSQAGSVSRHERLFLGWPSLAVIGPMTANRMETWLSRNRHDRLRHGSGSSYWHARRRYPEKELSSLRVADGETMRRSRKGSHLVLSSYFFSTVIINTSQSMSFFLLKWRQSVPQTNLMKQLSRSLLITALAAFAFSSLAFAANKKVVFLADKKKFQDPCP